MLVAGASAGVIAAWAAGARSRTPTVWVRPDAELVAPTNDLVSVAYWSVDDDRYAPLLVGAEQRLNAYSMGRFRTSLDDLPGRLATLVRRVPRAVVETRILRDQIRSLRRTATLGSIESLPRLDIWRSDESSRRARRARVARALSRLEAFTAVPGASR